jgi:AraC family transcriptional regulator
MREYEKWAAVEVSEFDTIPDGMERLIVPEGLYAVFHCIGKPSEAQEIFRFIYGPWLPDSEFKMDARPYFALMGDKYKGESPDSEEEFWIPIIRK